MTVHQDGLDTDVRDPGDPAAPRPTARRPQRRTSSVVGVLLIALGVGVLGWAGWQYWGTNWVSHRNQDAVVSQLEKQWDQGADQARTEHGLAGAIVRIPRFGKKYAVPVLQGVSDEVLASGYGHFEGTANPGQLGNFALAAHRVTHGEPLHDMPDLVVGDKIIIETRSMTYTYELTSGGDDLTVPFTQSWVVGPQPVNPRAGGVTPVIGPEARLITLTTCSELFHTDNRLIAFGTLVKAEARV